MANINCGHCHKTHGSVAEVRECSTRKTTRPSGSGARKPRRSTGPALEYPNNPFFQDHLDAELVYSSGGMYNRRQLTAIVIDEFLRSGYPDEAMECGNCHKMNAWYRPTVGAVMCVACASVRCGRVDQATGKVEIHWTKH